MKTMHECYKSLSSTFLSRLRNLHYLYSCSSTNCLSILPSRNLVAHQSLISHHIMIISSMQNRDTSRLNKSLPALSVRCRLSAPALACTWMIYFSRLRRSPILVDVGDASRGCSVFPSSDEKGTSSLHELRHEHYGNFKLQLV